MNTFSNPNCRFLLLVLLFLFSNQLVYAQTPDNANEDKDKDGITVGQGDCDDYQPLVYPGANEIEDGQDNDCDGIVDAVQGDCDDFTDPGEISGTEILCVGELPNLIESVNGPSGGTGEMQIMWIYTIDDPEQTYPEWYIIPNAHQLTLQPSAISQTTWFGRCVRRAGCWKFPNESNVIKKEVKADCSGIDCSEFSVTVANSSSPDCDGNLGSIDLTVNNGLAPMTYNWSDGTTTKDRTDLSGGNYQVTVTDANGCSGTAEVNIPSPSCAPDCSEFSVTVANSSSPDCDGNLGSIDLTLNNGVAPMTYNWSDGATTKDRTGLSGGNYQVTVTDANGCSGTTEVNIPTPSCAPDCSAFSVTVANSSSPDCDGNLGSIDLTVNNGLAPMTYSWSDGTTTKDRTDLSGGNYQVTVTDANGCSGTTEVNIPTPSCAPDCSAFLAEITEVTFVDCDGNFGSITLEVTNAVAPINYQWSDGATTQNRIGLVGGNYEVTITDANNCSDTLRAAIATPACGQNCNTFSVSVASSSAPDCDGNLGAIDILVNNDGGNTSYFWSDGARTEDRSGLAGGNYQVIVFTFSGCTDTAEVNIPTPTCAPDCSAFSVSIANSSSPDCDGNLGTIDILVNNGEGAITYTWSDGATTKDRTDLSGGNYQVTVTDANGCSGTAEVNIPTPSCAPDCSEFSVTVANNSSPDCDGNLGSIDLTVNNGVAPMTYNWLDGATTKDRTGLSGGNYQVTVSDANGCSGTTEVNIPTPSCAPDCSSFSVTVANSSSPDCDGNLGSIDLTVNNGVAPMTYSWSDGATTKDRTGLSGGNYQVTVTDANGCSGTAEVNIPSPSCAPDCSEFSVTVANSSSPDCDGNLGSIDLTVNNGVAPMTYNWSDGAITKDRTDLSGGNYQVTVSDANGCSGTAEVNIPAVDCAPDCSAFSVTGVISSFPECDGNLGSIDLTVNNGVAPMTYNWSDGTTTKDRTGLSGGNYQVTVTDANGCSGTAEVNIPTPSCAPDCSIFAAQVISTTTPDCEGNQGTIEISFINGSNPITYLWADGANTANRTDLSGGNYQVTLTDANGCSDNLEINLPTPDCAAQCSIFEVLVNNTTAPDCEDNLGSIDLTVQNGLAPLTFAWQDGATSEDRINLVGGSYMVTVSDANGCFEIVEISIPTPNCGTGCDNFIIPFTIANVTCSENSGGINISAFGGTAPYTFNWADLTGNIEDRNELTVGDYEVTVTDAVGCEKTASITVGTADCVLEITPFDCSASFFQITEGQLSIVDFANDSLIPIGEEGGNLNPLGYNVEDDFIYGIRFGTTDFVRIGKNGNREIIGRIQGINVGLYSGDFDLEGNYYLLDNASQRLQRVDISAPVLVAATIELSENIPSLADVSYNPNDKLLYGVSEFANDVFSIHPITGVVENFNVPALPVGTVGSTWMTSRGDFVVNYNVSGEIYVIDLTTQTARLLGNNGGSVSNADGANCVQAQSPFGGDGMLFNPDFSFRNVSGTMTNEMARINYEVEHEAQNAHYVLEHSLDGSNFKVLPSLEFANGETVQSYTMNDETPALGSGFYRVKYVEADGEFTYSDLVPLLFKPDGTPDVIIHPNPFMDEMMINFLDPLAQDAEVMVVNNLGKVMEVCSAAQGATRMNISCPSYPPGLYTVYIKPQGKLPIVYRTLKVE